VVPHHGDTHGDAVHDDERPSALSESLSALVLGHPAVLAQEAANLREPLVRIEVRNTGFSQKQRLVRQLERDTGDVLVATYRLVQEAGHRNWSWRLPQTLNRLRVEVNVEQVTEIDAQREPECWPGEVQSPALNPQRGAGSRLGAPFLDDWPRRDHEPRQETEQLRLAEHRHRRVRR